MLNYPVKIKSINLNNPPDLETGVVNIKLDKKHFVVIGIVVILVLAFIAYNFIFLWVPDDDEKEEESQEFVITFSTQQMLNDFNPETGSFYSVSQNEWFKVNDTIMNIRTEEDYLGPGHNAYVKSGDDTYEYVAFVWVESLGDATFTFNFSIAAKKPEHLNILKKGEALELELTVTDLFIKGNVAGHKELVYDPAGLKIE